MNRLLDLESNLIASTISTIDDFQTHRRKHVMDSEEFQRIVYGPNYKWRNVSFNFMRRFQKEFTHYHLIDASKEFQRQQSAKLLILIRLNSLITKQESQADPNTLSCYTNSYIWYDIGMSVKGGVHFFLYMKAIQSLGCTPYHQEMFDRGSFYEDLGCFGLTELNHGSNVKGIQTEAHYDHQRRQFVIHTPHKQAMKFWIGGSANMANMSVIWAQLYINGKCYGVHAYLVPLRDANTHKFLPGVTVGDCGTKNGLNSIDNGFILFDKVRIPVKNQLNKISGVDQNGNFKTIIQNQQKRFGLQLAALSGGRFFISTNSATLGLTALTIAIRYASLRRQFTKAKGLKQSLIIDYPLSKRRLMPHLALMLCHLTANMSSIFQWDKYNKTSADPTNPIVQDLHAISSVMKSQSSWAAAACIKQCRQIMGGHGYSAYSKMAVLYNDNDVNVTWEGDNHVLIQQATKYVLDNASKVMQKGKPASSPLLKFLQNPPSEMVPIDKNSLIDFNNGILFFQYKMITKIQQMGMHMLGLKNNKVPTMDIWNGSQIYLGKDIAVAFGNLFVLSKMIEKIKQCKTQSNKAVFTISTTLWLLQCYKQDQLVDQTHAALIETLMLEYSEKLADYSLAILQAFAPSDDIIGSPFASVNGRGFSKYYHMIKNSKQNARPEWWEMIVNR